MIPPDASARAPTRRPDAEGGGTDRLGEHFWMRWGVARSYLTQGWAPV
jgi:hypothetical protein